MHEFVRKPPDARRKPPATQRRPADRAVAKTLRPTTDFSPQAASHLARRLGHAPAHSSRDIWRTATAAGEGPLPHRGTLERLFGRSFAGVRAYFGRGQALDALGAKAATDGERVAFASHTPDVRQVSHELAHVVQMGGGGADGSRLSEPGSPAEREAHRIAERAGAGKPVSVAEAAPAALHRDLKSGKLEVPEGYFRIDMTKVEIVGGRSGEDGTVEYTPKPTAPDTDRVRLSQAQRRTNLAKGTEFDWAPVVADEADRDSIRTESRRRVHVTVTGDTLASISEAHFGSSALAKQVGKDNVKLLRPVAAAALADPAAPLPAGLSLQILGAVKVGYGIDHFPSDPKAVKRAKASSPAVLQDYVWPGEHTPNNHDGHKKGPDDIRKAILHDAPGTGAFHIMQRFETVARSDDIGLYYGTLWWQFEVNSTVLPPKVTKENYGVWPGVSDTFRAALVKFDRFYKNPHSVVAGQTLEQISMLYFGKPDQADAIFERNKASIGARNAPLKPGLKLLIPKVSAGADKP